MVIGLGMTVTLDDLDAISPIDERREEKSLDNKSKDAASTHVKMGAIMIGV